MRWSWRVGRILGIDLYVHVTFLLLLAWVFLAHFFLRYSWRDAAEEALFITLVFGIVVLHELGHALAARHYGIATRDITLLPIGGVARLERMPEDPRQELVVALAGPAVNVALAAGVFAWMAFAGAPPAVADLSVTDGALPARLFFVNVWLVLFNMLPAFPMDGGRVLRAVLALGTDYVRATQIAAGIGQGMALLFGFLGLFVSPMLIFVALFVWIGAAQEAAGTQLKAALGGLPVQRATITEYRTLAPSDTLGDAAKHVLAGFQQDFPVVGADGRVVGMLTRPALIAGLADRGEATAVENVMATEFEKVDAAEMLEGALARLQECDCHSAPVFRGDKLIGLVTMENVGELLMIESALRGRTTA